MSAAQRCLLGIFAHPDDEALGMAGTFRRYDKQGVRTALICATRGEEGEISDSTLATRETLGQVREQELREACRILGIKDLTFLGYHDGLLDDVDEHQATERIVRHIRRLRPQILVTFDENGAYGHRDHMAIHRLTCAAFHMAGDPLCHPEQITQGLQPYAPRKLYFTAFARSLIVEFQAYMQNSDDPFQPGGTTATIPLAEMGTPDERITTMITLSDEDYEIKQRARQAHRTQMAPNDLFNSLSPDAAWRVLGIEYFVRAYPPSSSGDGREQDLFAE